MSTVAAGHGRTVLTSADVPRVSASRTRLRLTRRGRIVFTLLGALPVVALAVAIVLGSTAAAAGSGASVRESFEFVTVGPGDTLWELAVDAAPDEDPRDVIAEILRLNGLADSVIEPGQRLALPNLD